MMHPIDIALITVQLSSETENHSEISSRKGIFNKDTVLPKYNQDLI